MNITSRRIWSALLCWMGLVPFAHAGTPFPERLIDDEAFNPTHIAVADLDNDGDQDLIVVSGSGDELFEGVVDWYENDGEDQPGFTRRGLGALNTPGAAAIDVGDINGDGLVDLAMAVSGAKALGLEWFRNNGGTPPTFTHVVTETPPLSNTNVFLTDLDGDGDIDPVLPSGWLENDGALAPSFTYHPLSAGKVATSFNLLDAADMDGDGDVDLLGRFAPFANPSYAVGLFLNDGAASPTFAAEMATSVISQDQLGPFEVHAADIDGDGAMDILSRTSIVLRWYQNNGAPSPEFAQMFIAGPYEGGGATALADLDGDGDPDYLIRDTGRIIIYENRVSAMGAWFMDEIAQEILPNDNARGIAVADMDADGDRDIAAIFSPSGGTNNEDVVSWFEQGGEFIPDLTEACLQADISGNAVVDGADLAQVINNWGTAFGDLNGDGTTDAHDLAFLLANWGPCFD